MNIAKNGYKEEELVCKDLNNNITGLVKFNNNYERTKNKSKVDIKSIDNKIMCQIKKYKKNQFQQLDRHWIDDIIKVIPELEEIKYMLKNLCEIELLPNKTHINKTKNRLLLSLDNYDKKELDNLLFLLNNNKQKILEYVFYGTNEYKPKYLIAVEYVNNERDNISIFRINKIIKYLMNLDFEITKKKSVIKLGNCISFQRKGGDNGKKSSNQFQTKIIISSLTTIKHINIKL